MIKTLLPEKERQKGMVITIPRIILPGAFALFIYIMKVAPLCSDDFENLDLNLTRLSDIIRYALYYGNGRVLGNIGSFLMVNSEWFNVIGRALILSSMIVLLPYALKCRSKVSYIASFILMAGCAPKLFAQVYAWISGFQNYIPGIWLTLVIIAIIRKFEEGNYSGLWIRIAAGVILILGSASQLFVEHTTIINIMLAFVFMFKAYRFGKDGNKLLCISWLAATCFGAVVMILIPKLFMIEQNRSTGYRSIDITRVFYHGRLLTEWLVQNTFLLTAWCVIGIFMVWFFRTKLSEKTVYGFLTLYVLAAVWFLIEGLLIKDSLHEGIKNLEGTVSFAMLLMMAAGFVFIATKGGKRSLIRRTAILMVLAVVALAPFLIVSPIKIRVVFQAYVLLVSVMLCHIDRLMQWAGEQIEELKICYFGALAALALSAALLMTYTEINRLDNIRTRYITEQMAEGAGEIVVYTFPTDYVYDDAGWPLKTYYYYQERGDITFTMTDYLTWMRNYGG